MSRKRWISNVVCGLAVLAVAACAAPTGPTDASFPDAAAALGEEQADEQQQERGGSGYDRPDSWGEKFE